MDKQMIALPIKLGDTIFTVVSDETYLYGVEEHVASAYLIRGGNGEEPMISAVGYVDDDGRFCEYDSFGAGTDKSGNWRGAFSDKDAAQKLADKLNVDNAEFRANWLAKRGLDGK